MKEIHARCAVCRKAVPPRSANPMYPFCSERCRMVDLGKWLGEEYRVASSNADEQEDELPSLEADPSEGER